MSDDTRAAEAATPTDDAHPDAGTGSLIERIARIAASLGRIPKTGQVTGRGGYRFAGIDTMADVLRPKMAAEGIAMWPAEVTVLHSHEVERVRTNDDGVAYSTYQWRHVVKIAWRVEAAGFGLTLVTIGEALDTSDKSANKAQTAARKYAMIQLFNISTGDEPDPDGERPGDEGETRPRGAPSSKAAGYAKRLVKDFGEQFDTPIAALQAIQGVPGFPPAAVKVLEAEGPDGIVKLGAADVSAVIDALKKLGDS